MNVVFVHDHKFKNNGREYFSEGKITDDVFSRYVLPSENFTVISRMEHINDSSNLLKIESNNINFSPVKGLSFSKVFSRHLFRNSKDILQKITYSDFIVVRLPSFLGVYVLVINIFTKKKYFIELVGDPKEALMTSKEDVSLPFKFFVHAFSELNKFFIKNAHGVIYVTESALQMDYPTNGLTEHASNVEMTIKEKRISIEDYKIQNNLFKIGLIGSFNNHYKGITEAINAMSLLNDSEKKFELHILGSGTLKDDYNLLAKELGVSDLVFFDGIVKGGNKVADWLSSLDLYIQPSYTEGLPRALIEAMSVGLPAVASDVGGIPELLSKDTLVKPYDSEALAKKIKDFVDSQKLRFEQGKLNYQKAKEYDQKVLKKRRSEFWQSARDIVKRSLV
ncbi:MULTISPECIES: glycosyltransferase [unclassified Psychrobacter]|uniref:glycosyltransferase n=1 Tax=unclassified Psychrobacter TaxID=196806 RepID=UPI003F9B384B